MKRKIMVAATGLSAGTLIATAVVNPKVASELMRTELVMADGTEESQSIKEMMPDLNLRLYIAGKLGKFILEPNDLTNSKLTEITLNTPLYYNLKGIEHVTALEKLELNGTNIKDISMLSGMENLEISLIGNKITNFDVLYSIKGKKTVGSIVSSKEDAISFSADQLELNLSDYIGKNQKTETTINRVKINGDTLSKASYDSKLRTIVIDDMVSRTENESGVYSGEVTIELVQKPLVTDGLGKNGIITIITQPYTITKSEPKVTTEDITINVGTSWNRYDNFVSATDEFNRTIPKEEFEVDEDVDIFTVGTYLVTYKHESGLTSEPAEVKVTAPEPEPIPDPDPEPTPDPDPGDENPNIEEIPKTDIMTNKPTLDIYNSEGTKTGTKKLTDEITDFTTEKLNKLKNGEYYQIGDNEWVSVEDVAVFKFTDSYIQTHGSKVKDLTDFGNTGALTDRALDKSSSWYTDRSAYFDGELHHRVSTHEWVHDDHIVQYEIASGVVHATETATLYNSRGKEVTDRALAKGSTFFTDRKATIDGKLMYRVATNEWVDADTVTFK